MKNLVPLSFVLLFCLAVAIGGCAGQGQRAYPATTPSPVPTPSVACTPLSGYTIAMDYPIPQSTGVLSEPSAQPNGILLSVAPTPLPTGWYMYVVDTTAGNSPAAQGGPAAIPSPLPTPYATPFPQSTLQFFDFGFWAYNSDFTAYLANSNCYPGLAVGSFSVGNM